MVSKFNHESPGFELPAWVNMGICLILTTIVAVAAILGCLLMLFCIKMATDRDERRRLASNAAKKCAEEGRIPSSVSANTSTAATMEADEKMTLTKPPAYDENDI